MTDTNIEGFIPTVEKSEIINHKKQLILKVDQTNDFVYPNELFKYQIYCKNVSGDTIENVHIQVINPSAVALDEDEYLEGVSIGNLNNGQSHLLYLPARCNEVGEFTLHFICYGDGSELVTKKITVTCDYNTYNNETIHKIHIYNFTPYEEKYELHSRDYNEDVTQLIKKQKLPYKAKENPFKMIVGNIHQNILVDESQNYIDQKNILYGNLANSDEHSYQYLERENFNKESVESFEGKNLREIFDNINKYSKIMRAKFIRTGTNKLLNDFRQYSPDGFIYRFGLMNSEIFHHVGVLPEYSYMNDYLFRWASEGQLPLNLYPQRLDMHWDANKWAGHGWHVYKTYTDEYKEQIINNIDYSPLMEFIQTFEDRETAEQYISNEYEYDLSNEFYIYTENGLEKIKKYKYIIKESYYDNGVFFVHIPLNKIPSNFYLLDTDQIEAIIEKTKPYGMKALIKYVLETKFNLDMGFKAYTQLKPRIPFEIEDFNNISWSSVPYKYGNIIETICYTEPGNDTPQYQERESIKLVPQGTAYDNTTKIDIDPKINFLKPEPTNRSGINIDPEINAKKYSCKTDTELSVISQIQNLLYQKNFDDISFYITDISSQEIKEQTDTISFDKISAVNYKLWKDCLFPTQENDPHSHWWGINDFEEDVDFFEIQLTNLQLTQDGVEVGIGLQDITNKIYGISSEFSDALDTFQIKHAKLINNNFSIIKEGLSDITGLAFKLIKMNNNYLIVFFLKQTKDDSIKYHYFDHIITNQVKSLFCFTRNDKDITTIKKWSHIIRFGKNTDPHITFNTPQYKIVKKYDPSIIVNQENSNWKNINRIDKNEQSYTIMHNLSNEEISVDDIQLHFDNIDVPQDAIIKSLRIRSTLETNSYKNIHPFLRTQDGILTQQSNINKIAMYPNEIETYPRYNQNLQYYKDQYQEFETNNLNNKLPAIQKKINENILFNENLNYSVSYLNEIDDYISVYKPYWIELYNFSDQNITLNDINTIKFCIEGYNKGQEVVLSLQLKNKDLYGEKTQVRVPSGYFKLFIPLQFQKQFILNELSLKFRFNELNNEIQIFDTYLEAYFSKKQTFHQEFESKGEIPIDKKKIIEHELLDKETIGYILHNGLSVQLKFDNLDASEYYRIYSIELDVVYEKQNITFAINSNDHQIDYNNSITVVNGKSSDMFASGKFINEVIMPGTYQPKSTLNAKNQGIELQDALFQSFIATSDNITSFTIYPNGFIGNPDINLKIALYENKGNSPNKLIKEIRTNGWTKGNLLLKQTSMITYDFYVDNLTIGNKYWLKIEVDTPSENNYYLLKYADSSTIDSKLLVRINNNLINTFGSLKLHINTLNLFRSFSSFPVSEELEDFSDPKIFITLSKRIGEINNIRVQKDYR